jgi:hypothetical protein
MSECREKVPVEQRVTVSGLYRPGWHRSPSRWSQIPLLQLAGTWLEEQGFHVGSRVRVISERGRVVIELEEG